MPPLCLPLPASAPDNTVRHRRFGAAVCSLAGGWWCWAPVSHLPVPPLVAQATLVIVATALFAAASHAIRHYRGPAAPRPDRRLMLAAMVAEAAMILLGADLAMRAGRPDLVLPAIALSVGLHFLPMAASLRYPPYRVTGLCICAVTLLSVTLPRDAAHTVLGAGVGLSLLLTSLHMTMRLRRLNQGGAS